MMSNLPVVQRGGSVDEHRLSPADQKVLPTVADTPGLVSELAALKQAKKDAADAGIVLTKPELARIDEIEHKLSLRTIGDESETLRRNGRKETVAAWFNDVKPFKFLGRTTNVHALLAERLTIAEAALQSEAPPPGGWVKEGHSGLREPGQGLHSLGLAIDLNPSTNPWLINPDAAYAQTVEHTEQSQAVRNVIDRAVLLVNAKTRKEADLQSRPTVPGKDERVEASYDKLADASSALARYFLLKDDELETLVGQLGAKDPFKGKVAKWKAMIASDRRTIRANAANKKWDKPETGFLDLDKRLVKAMTDSSGAGLTWLGDDTIAMGRDIMHFDTRGLDSVHIRNIWNSTQGGSVNIGDG